MAEIENKTVIDGLIDATPLQDIDYAYVHYDSPDERGIDCALIYHQSYFKVSHSEPISVVIFDKDGRRDLIRFRQFIEKTIL